MSDLIIRNLLPHEAETAAALIGRSFCNNPLFVRIFGMENPVHRQNALTQFYCRMLNIYLNRDRVFGAFREGTLCGTGVLIYPGNCKPTPREKLQILQSLISGNPARTTMGALQWLRYWVKHDPPESHWHIGPVNVEPGLQSKGVGALLLTEICRAIDDAGGLAFVEADTPESVRFYARFGFSVTATVIVHQVPTWFLSRRINPQGR